MALHVNDVMLSRGIHVLWNIPCVTCIFYTHSLLRFVSTVYQGNTNLDNSVVYCTCTTRKCCITSIKLIELVLYKAPSFFIFL